MPQMSRRHVLVLGAGGALSAKLGPALANEVSSHGLSAFGELKYPAGFAKFDYVNSDAPKGGLFSQLVGSGGSTFDSFNAFIVKGNAASDMDLTFASLMARAFDEPDAVYLFAAEELSVSADRSSFRFKLRPGITFHDGSKITSEDVAFSLNVLKAKGHPSYGAILAELVDVVVEDPRTVLLKFSASLGLDVPPLAAALPIFSKAYYANRSFDDTSLEPPLGSGAYRVSRFEQGRFVEFERVKDWWGADLPVCRGQYNFDVFRDEYYRDRETGFEAFTGRNYLFREEFTSRVWATRYEFPAFKDGRVKREIIPDERPSGAQGWLINTRREKFRDRRVREAIGLAFDFEWTNKNLMYGSYQRTRSVFENSEMMAKGEASADELALLEPFRDRLLPEVFGPVWLPPESDGSGQDRKLLRRAGELLVEAGWTIKDGRRVNPSGEPLTLEFLLDERSFEPHHTPFIKNLRVLGIEASLRFVDPTQEELRKKEFDFDIAIDRFIYPQIPGAALRNYFSSKFVQMKGSKNLAGISDPVIDVLVEKAASAKTQSELYSACRALDRVLRSGRYWIPHWNKASFWIAYWDEFGHPQVKPRFARGVPETWWSDKAKAAKLEQAK